MARQLMTGIGLLAFAVTAGIIADSIWGTAVVVVIIVAVFGAIE